MIAFPVKSLLVLTSVGLGAFVLSWALIILLRPVLVRHALARPTPRSSHHQPTPQGGGLAVIIATLAATWGAVVFAPGVVGHMDSQFAAVTGAVGLLALIGGLDDIRSLPAGVRLLAQGLAVGIVIAALPKELQLFPFVPLWFERASLLIAGVWFVNLVNFMDGVDWMTVAEVLPITGAVVILALYAGIGVLPMLVAAALLGAMAAFAPFNKPLARLFLGDVGSLPIGLLLAWLLFQVAGRASLTAAILLPLYFVADATITLGRRLITGERVWEAHRSHFYQRATGNGFTVPQVVARVAAVNLALVALALAAAAIPTPVVASLSMAAGCALVGWLLVTFARGKQR